MEIKARGTKKDKLSSHQGGPQLLSEGNWNNKSTFILKRDQWKLHLGNICNVSSGVTVWGSVNTANKESQVMISLRDGKPTQQVWRIDLTRPDTPAAGSVMSWL